MQADIKTLERALAALPSGREFTVLRDSIANKIAVLKRQIVEAKPIGQRLDGTRDALARAVRRQEQAEAALAQAHAAVQATTTEVDKLTTELACLESMLAPPASGEPLRFYSLETHLAAAVDELVTTARSTGEDADDARAALALLLRLADGGAA